MTEPDARLADELREYYSQLHRQEAPDMSESILLATERRTAMRRRWGVVAGGLAAAAVAAVVVVALANHNRPTSAPVGPAHSPTSTESAAPSASAAPGTPTPSSQPQLVGPVTHGFKPTDVTAISASDWWVLGYDGPQCSSSSCTRILHTIDGGRTFTSIPTPPVAPAPSAGQQLRLRFADGSNGWLVDSGGTLWSTHDGGSRWARQRAAARVTDVEASGGEVYEIACASSSSCLIERSATGQDAWTPMPGSNTVGPLRDLLVNGSHIWAVEGNSSGGGTALLVSSDGGITVSTREVCARALGVSSIYAVDTSVLWATCATGTQATVYLSTNGGASFQPEGDGIANSSSIAGVSPSVAVVGSGTELERSTDGGRAFAAVQTGSGAFTVVGFTTPLDGFALEREQGTQVLWRTDDAGAHWHSVAFP